MVLHQCPLSNISNFIIVIIRPCYSQFGGKDYGEICPPYFGWLIKLFLHPLICGCMAHDQLC
jgi:hypothetical protein